MRTLTWLMFVGLTLTQAQAATVMYVAMMDGKSEAPAVETVVERSDRFAKLPQARHRGVLLVAFGDGHLVDARGRAWEIAGLGLTLSEVAPVRMSIVKS